MEFLLWMFVCLDPLHFLRISENDDNSQDFL